MNEKIGLPGLLLLALLVHSVPAHAVCRDPVSGRSGYKLPLAEEVHTAEAVIIGRVLSEQRVQEDPDDPEGLTASRLGIKVLKKLKGSLPGVIIVENENTSSRYPMSVGEEHILFISSANRGKWIDSCGNSEAMPGGQLVARKVRALLER
ncbi:hypothetical protein LE190_19650 [Massilia oculi]|uniref:Uncharacterized protein n=1 Tax=Massilia hydrophila TaxID=3044279 RepID=A0ABS7YGH9_9BURK|nr:hypothetical protein [Massilia oculi]MCA1858127.1 hypothetical protein [Massilia oculi]